MNTTAGKQAGRVLRLLLIGAILVNIKSIFSDFNIDSEYAVVMSFRQTLGDKMFTQMWEPHQTSAFLLTMLMELYLLITKTTTGVVIFLHIAGVLCFGGLTISLYKVLKKWLDPTLVLLMCIFFFTVRAKGVVLLEYSNMQIGFSALLFLCLLLYFENQHKIHLLIIASICQCLMILSYPSCLIVYFIVILLFLVYSNRKLISLALFSLFCMLQGIGYILFFVAKIGWQDLSYNVIDIINADKSHDSQGINKVISLFSDTDGLWLIGCCLAALAAGVLMYFVKSYQAKQKILWGFSLLIMAAQLIQIIVYHQEFLYLVVYVLFLFFGTFGVKYCDEIEKRIYFVGILLSAGSFLATALLTNLGLMSVTKYLIVAVMVSFIPVKRWMEQKLDIDVNVLRWNILFLFCGFAILYRGIMVKSFNGEAPTIFDFQGVVTAGPAMGIVTDYMGMYETRCDIEDFGQYVNSGDRLLMVDGGLIHVLGYFYQDVSISVHSTICTPTYDEMLLEYWEENPDKFPNVIAVSCWYGDLHVDENSWIYQWIQREFQPSTYTDGRYWRFYRLEMEEP